MKIRNIINGNILCCFNANNRRANHLCNHYIHIIYVFAIGLPRMYALLEYSAVSFRAASFVMYFFQLIF